MVKVFVGIYLSIYLSKSWIGWNLQNSDYHLELLGDASGS